MKAITRINSSSFNLHLLKSLKFDSSSLSHPSTFILHLHLLLMILQIRFYGFVVYGFGVSEFWIYGFGTVILGFSILRTGRESEGKMFDERERHWVSIRFMYFLGCSLGLWLWVLLMVNVDDDQHAFPSFPFFFLPIEWWWWMLMMMMMNVVILGFDVLVSVLALLWKRRVFSSFLFNWNN